MTAILLSYFLLISVLDHQPLPVLQSNDCTAPLLYCYRAPTRPAKQIEFIFKSGFEDANPSLP